MKKEFDPLRYIENAFLDTRPAQRKAVVQQPSAKEPGIDVKLKTTSMHAPRPRKRKAPQQKAVVTETTEVVWKQIPKNLKFLAGVYDDSVTRKYYTKDFKESREDLIMRIIDPQLNLEETARLLGVCPATVRRYTNRGWLEHHRTDGNQRRFKLSGIVNFVEEYGRNPE